MERFRTNRRLQMAALGSMMFLLFVSYFYKILESSEESALMYGDMDADEDELLEDDENEQATEESTRLSEIVAEQKIKAVKQILGKGRGPFVVGGIGDSGTRGFWDIFMKFGIYMQGQDNVRGDSRDSVVFMASRSTILNEKRRLLRNPSALYNEPIRKSRSINYNSSHDRIDRWNCGKQFIADMVAEIANDTIKHRAARGKPDMLYPFGFKHPRTALLLPFFYAGLGSKFAFIHVLRDGREVAAGDNNHLFIDHCVPYYGKRCDDSKAIEMWADLNRDVFEFALQSGMKANQYFAMRVEDLVKGQTACYEQLVKFLELPSFLSGKNMTDRIQRAVKSSMPHAHSYFGQKYTYNERQSMLNVKSQKARDALKFWGYDEKKFDLAVDCQALPWMEEYRRRKGKLPTD